MSSLEIGNKPPRRSKQHINTSTSSLPQVPQQPTSTYISSSLNRMSSQFFIPDLLVTWPWKRVLHPMLAEVKDEANAWVKSLDLFEPTQLKKFNACDFSMYLLFFFLDAIFFY